MRRSLLYGQRKQKAIERPLLLSYQALFESFRREEIDLPSPYSLKEAKQFKRADLRSPSVDFTVSGPQGEISGSLLRDHNRPTISLDYCPWQEDNERGLFAFFAARLAGEDALAYLNVPIKSQQLSLDNLSLEDFTTRYPLGWRLRSSYYFDHRSEEECMRELARSRSIDRRSKQIITSSASLSALIARPGGRQALMIFSANSFLHLKRPLRDLRLR